MQNRFPILLMQGTTLPSPSRKWNTLLLYQTQARAESCLSSHDHSPILLVANARNPAEMHSKKFPSARVRRLGTCQPTLALPLLASAAAAPRGSGRRRGEARRELSCEWEGGGLETGARSPGSAYPTL